MVGCSDFDILLAMQSVCFSNESWGRYREGVIIKWGTCLVKLLAPWKKKFRNLSGCCFFPHPNDTLHPWDVREFHHVPLRSFRERLRHIYLHRCQAGFVMHVTPKNKAQHFYATESYTCGTALFHSRLPAGDLPSHIKRISAPPLCVHRDA